MTRSRGRRRVLAHEVIQTSSMDCGPAALKSLLTGFGVDVSYGRLREACQTDLDGTSIDTIEEVAKEAGLDAEQVLVPTDHVLSTDAACVPCLAAVRGSGGVTHFLVIWRKHGPLIQVMDPARGRLWLTRAALIRQLVSHSMRVPASGWWMWASSPDFLRPLRGRLRRMGLSKHAATRQIDSVIATGSWRALATLDAAVRMVSALQDEGALPRRGAERQLSALCEVAAAAPSAIPEMYWSAYPTDDPEQAQISGAVLVRVKGRLQESVPTPLRDRSPELAAAFAEPPIRPLRDVLSLVRDGGFSGMGVLAAATAAVVLGVIFEAVLLRSAMDVRSLIQGPGQVVAAGVALVAFALLLLALDVLAATTERRLGNHLDARLRIAFLDKLPRLADAYFLSRPIADMLERSHTLHVLRTFPRLCVRFGRVTLELCLTTAALVWLNPETLWLAVSACVAALAIPTIGQSFVAERDLRARTHAGALARFHLDALRGRTPLETHDAQSAIEREHEMLLSEWAASALALQRTSMAIEGFQMAVGFGLAAWMLLSHVETHATAPLLLQAYWMLNLPGLGYELALIAREYPAYRSTIIRLLEPLRAPDRQTRVPTGQPGGRPARIALSRVSVHAAGHSILTDVNLIVSPGEHIAIVGPSGAGKSTLVGLLLGWNRSSEGLVEVDGTALVDDHLESLRASIAWVDPTVQLWNTTLLENLLYGSDADVESVGAVLEPAGLLSLVARLPEGLATRVGEGGALLSAGEAQRVRLARAMLKRSARLALLDEPFVGLERERRRALLTHVRQRWAETTLLYVTHDVPETRAFDRVLVLEHGRIVEDGDPQQLANSLSSRYRRLLQAHEAMQSRFASGEWRRLRLSAGRIVHEHSRTNEQTA